MCSDGVHCCYDDVPVCCLSSGACCPSDNVCCGSDCCSETDICCSDTSSCCPENKPVCCEDPEHCCEKDTTCCGEECCNSDQKCCTDKDEKKYCCSKDVDCCGDQCCTKNTECCELLEAEIGSKNACLTYHKVEEQLPAQPKVLTNVLFQSLGGDNNLDLLAISVGQGDCTMIFCPHNKDIVIVDMGASPGSVVVTATTIGDLLTDYFQRYPKAKMYNLITHPNIDHYNYFETAVAGCAGNVGCFVLGGVSNPSGYGAFGQWLQSSVFKNRIYVINEGKPCYGNTECSIHPPSQNNPNHRLIPQFCGDGVDFTIMAANQGNTVNSKSTVLKVQFDNWSALLPGDFETATAQTNIVAHYGPHLQSSCFKMAHHGAASQANFKNFLEAINPEVAFVSQMYPSDTSCHHPRCEAIERLQDVMSARRIAREEVSPFACWSKEKGKLKVISNFCFPIYATCRQKYICNSIVISSNGDVEYINNKSPVLAVDSVSADMLDCEDYDDDASDEHMSEKDPKERAQHPASRQEL